MGLVARMIQITNAYKKFYHFGGVGENGRIILK